MRTGLGLIMVVAGGAGVLAWALWRDAPDSSHPRVPSRLEQPPIAPAPLRDRFSPVPRGEDRVAPAADGADLAAMVDAALDPRAPLEQRVRALWWLGRSGSDEAVDVVERVLRSDAPAAVRAAAAQALGFSGHERVVRILASLLRDPEITVARGAIRGLAATGDPEFATLLEKLLHDPSAPDLVRAQAAVSLSDLIGPQAQESLLAAFYEVESDELAESVLEGLGRLPFERTAPFFEAVLRDEQLSDPLKAAALESLGDSTPDAAGLLYDVARSGASPPLRIAAVEALAFLEEAPNRPQHLIEVLASEAEPDVRIALYSTLSLDAREASTQAGAERILAIVMSEASTDARLEGFRLVAYMLGGGAEASLLEPFDSEMVSWLRDQAGTSESRHRRLVAVETLKVADTAESREALTALSRVADAEVAAAAARAIAAGN